MDCIILSLVISNNGGGEQFEVKNWRARPSVSLWKRQGTWSQSLMNLCLKRPRYEAVVGADRGTIDWSRIVSYGSCKIYRNKLSSDSVSLRYSISRFSAGIRGIVVTVGDEGDVKLARQGTRGKPPATSHSLQTPRLKASKLNCVSSTDHHSLCKNAHSPITLFFQ